MPIYEYRCRECGREFEMFRGIRDNGNPPCKFCEGSVRKLISLSSFHLKGTGWYVTDYAKKESSDGESPKQKKAESSDTTKKKEGTSSKEKNTD